MLAECKTDLTCFRGSGGCHGVRTTSSDWTEGATNGTHYWYEYEGSAMCNLTTPDKDCVSVSHPFIISIPLPSFIIIFIILIPKFLIYVI